MIFTYRRYLYKVVLIKPTISNRWIYLLCLLLFNGSVMSYSLQPHGLQHTRPPCPSPSPGACSDSCPLSRWYHPTTLSSVVPFSCLQFFPASGSFKLAKNHVPHLMVFSLTVCLYKSWVTFEPLQFPASPNYPSLPWPDLLSSLS